MEEMNDSTLYPDTESSNHVPRIPSNEYYLQAFLRELHAFGLSEGRIKRYERALRTQLKGVSTGVKSITKVQLLPWLVELQNSEYRETTKNTNKGCVKRFYKWLGNPQDWIPMNYKRTYREAAEILSRDEVMQIARHVESYRYRAYIKVLWESGCRFSELRGLRVKHIIFDKHGAILSITGKTGQRLVRLVETSSLLKELAIDLKPDDRVFPMQHNTVRQMIKRAAARAGIGKRVNPHSFRFSRATFLANRGFNLWQLMKFFGWSNPRTAQIYIRLSTGDIDEAILSLYRNVYK